MDLLNSTVFKWKKLPYHIFQIGFNRCGTTSIAQFFNKNGYKAANWRKGQTAIAIELARLRNEPLLTYTNNFDVYTDIEKVNLWRLPKLKWKYRIFRKYLNEVDGDVDDKPPVYAFKYFKKLHKQYPGSKFIFNTRDLENWIDSRLNLNANNNRIAYRSCTCGDDVHDSKKELTDCWREEWHRHHERLRSYFSDHPDDVLEFNIEQDPVDKLIAFFDTLDLDPTYWRQHNATDDA